MECGEDHAPVEVPPGDLMDISMEEQMVLDNLVSDINLVPIDNNDLDPSIIYGDAIDTPAYLPPRQ